MPDYQQPLVVKPLRSPHKQTFIILPGRGSAGERFGLPLLDTPFPIKDHSTSKDSIEPRSTLRQCFPHARFVFPTAPWSRATIYKRALMHQCFNNWKLDPLATEREELQVPGLRETTTYIHKLLQQEIDVVPGGASNVILGGLSQGCAASLTSLLLWQGDPLAVWFGMSGWLPFASTLLDNFQSSQTEGETSDGTSQSGEMDFDPFERSEEDTNEEPADIATSRLRAELSFEQPDIRTRLQRRIDRLGNTPVFFDHGVEDDTVSVVLGRTAHQCVKELGFHATWHEYEDLGHWYSEDILSDLVEFICEQPGWVSKDFSSLHPVELSSE